MNEQELNILISRYLEGNCSAGERRQLETWLQESEANRRHFEQIASIEGELKEIDLHLDPDTEGEWSRLLKNIEQMGEKSGKKEARRMLHPASRPGRYLRIAVAVAMLILAGWLVNDYVWNNKAESLPVVFETPKGTTRTVDLPDGSVVRLNADSRLTLARGFGKQGRPVMLEGEAYFEVAKDPEKAFIVQTGDVFTQVLGTTFILQAYPEGETVELAVMEGTVRFYTETQEGLVLNQEMGATFIRSSDRLLPKKYDPQITLDWLEGRMVFDDLPFREIFPALERRYDVRIIDRANLADTPYSDVIEKEEPLQEFLARLSISFDLITKMEKDTVTITRKE